MGWEPRRFTVGVFVAVFDAADNILVIQKQSGVFGLPGGGLDFDEDPKQGACRELFEETGLRALSEDVIFLDVYANTARQDIFLISACRRFEGSVVVHDVKEVAIAQWVSVQRAQLCLPSHDRMMLERALVWRKENT